jgi:hypothetical protein
MNIMVKAKIINAMSIINRNNKMYEESNSTQCTSDFCETTTFVIKPLEQVDTGAGFKTSKDRDWEFRRKNNYKQKRRK